MNTYQRIFGTICAALLLGNAFVGCSDGDDNCACTAMYCAGTLDIQITSADGEQLEAGQYTLDWQLDETSGSLTTTLEADGASVRFAMGEWTSDAPEGFSQALAGASSVTVVLTLGGQELYQGTLPLEHQEAVCNECSGGPSCSDDMYVTTEPLAIQLASSSSAP